MAEALETGQVTDAPETTSDGQVDATPADSGTIEQTTDQGTVSEESFFDINELDPGLLPAYKQMQGAFSKKMGGFTEQQSKIDAFDAFQNDPQAEIRRMAQQYGIELGQPKAEENFDPQNWDDVMSMAKSQIMEELSPLFKDVQATKKASIETKLDSDYPDWRTYETEMIGLLKTHPSLSQDTDMLYKMAVPESIQMAKATKIALDKLKNKTDGATMSSGSTTARQLDKSKTVSSFSEAVQMAKQNLADQGVTKP